MMTPRNALSLSARVFLALAWLALPAFSTSAPEAREHKPKGEAATTDGGDSKDKKDEKKDDKDAPKEPAFDKVVKGTKELQGLFRVYFKEDDAKYFLEIAPDQLDVPFLLNPTLVSGIGQGFIYPSDMLPEYVVAFHKSGKTVQLIHRNTLFRADESSTLRKPATLAAPDAIVGQAKVESQPHPDRKSVLIDLGSIAVGDLEGLTQPLKQVFESPYQLDRDGSTLAFAKNFPDNLDFETVLHFKTPEIKKPAVYAADPRSMLVRFHYSLSRLPQTGFRPRLADDRVGHFLAMMGDYTDDRPDVPTVRYVTRWQMEKKDPAAAISEPKQPIVFYLEDSIPKEYREAVRQGVLGWNPAFEKIGFKNALVVKEQPDDPDWDAADVRYSTLRWIVAPNAGFAQGPSRINPYTGQIFDADIRFSADMLRNIRHEYEELVAPIAARPGDGSVPAETAALLRTLSGWTASLGPFPLDSLIGALDGTPGAPAGRAVLGAGSRPGVPPASLGYCDYATGLAHEAALGWSILQARGGLDEKAQQAYIDDFIVSVTLHEVGHTLGLRHNFKASNSLPFEKLQDAALTSRAGMTGSVMDYTPVNLAPEGKPQGEYWQRNIGAYDFWAIEYAYKPIDAPSTAAERPELDRIASRVSEPGLAYGTDEDTFTGSPKGIDPTSNMWDLGSDILTYYSSRAGLARELIGKMEDRFNEPGLRYQKLRVVFAQAVGELAPAALNVPKYIGGIRHYRDHIGDPNGRLPYDPVPAPEQRAALAFLNQEIFGPDAFKLPSRLLNKLAVERFPDIEGNFWTLERIDLPIHTVVLALQSIPMDRLYHPIALGRLLDIEERYDGKDKAFTMSEMFSSVRRAVWSELDGRASINSFRRNLQRKHLQTLIGLAVGSEPSTPEDARTLARADLMAIRRGIDAVLGRVEGPAPRVDVITRAHLDETRARITAALDAGIQRQLPQATQRPQG
ncbi:MAG TPA: zinc-dependent metalloprotease [Candidatus Polarisedimenticolia bacterium]|nr:zinc-dependent metalloprotease [Candidatus Polarisedimenticolia bacterium]